MVTAPTIHVTRDRYHLAWDPAIEPIATIDSGGVVEFDLLDASCGQLDADCGVPQLLALNFERVDQVGGPIAVNGAEPGDTLQIDLLDFQPASWGWTAIIPGFGLLADEFPEATYHVTRLGPGGPIDFMPGIRLPRAPFCGVIGVAPTSGPLSTIPPDVHGGNMDTRHLVAGSTLYLPVFQPGARLSVGRRSRRRRATARSAARRSRRRCARRCGCPCGRTSTSRRRSSWPPRTRMRAAPERRALRDGRRRPGPPRRGARRDATDDRLARPRARPGAGADAYMLCSVAVDLRISEIVDMPNYLVTAYCPLGIFA